jgi:hypothetical protein
MTTLESAIRQIDRESRQLLQQTFDLVNVNFGKLFLTLFGGQARLILTGRRFDSVRRWSRSRRASATLPLTRCPAARSR